MIEEKKNATTDTNKAKDPDKSCLGWTVKNALVPILVAVIGAYAVLAAAKILPSPFSSAATSTPTAPGAFTQLTDNYYASGYWTHPDGSISSIQQVADTSSTGCLSKQCLKIAVTWNGAWDTAGVFWQHPVNNWGNQRGCNLTGATSISFWSRGEVGGEVVRFLAACQRGNGVCVDNGQIMLEKTWQHYSINISGQNLTDIHAAFEWIVASQVTFYLDEIRIEGINPNQISCPMN